MTHVVCNSLFFASCLILGDKSILLGADIRGRSRDMKRFEVAVGWKDFVVAGDVGCVFGNCAVGVEHFSL